MQVKEINVNPEIILRQIGIEDAIDVFNTIDTQRVYMGEWLPFVEHTKSVDNTIEFINASNGKPENERDSTFTIQYKGEFAGIIGFKGTDKSNMRTEIGYWLSEPFQKKGIMTLSVSRLIKFAFEDLGIHRVQIKCATGNTKSKNIPLRLGFGHEGTERDGELLSGGKFTDIEVYSYINKPNIV